MKAREARGVLCLETGTTGAKVELRTPCPPALSTVLRRPPSHLRPKSRNNHQNWGNPSTHNLPSTDHSERLLKQQALRTGSWAQRLLRLQVGSAEGAFGQADNSAQSWRSRSRQGKILEYSAKTVWVSLPESTPPPRTLTYWHRRKLGKWWDEWMKPAGHSLCS